jgi:hypothetical protein
MSCCRGTGDPRPLRDWLWRPDHARQQGRSCKNHRSLAADIGESVDRLYDIAMEMDVEDGVIWVYGPGDDQVMAFTDFGIETLIDLIKIHRDLSSAKS